VNNQIENIIEEIRKHKLKPKQIIEKYGEQTLKQIITYLNNQEYSITDIAAFLNLKSTSYFKELLRKLGLKVEAKPSHHMKPLIEDRTQELLKEARENPKVMNTVKYILENKKPPPWIRELPEKQLAETILWLNHVEKWSLRKLSKTLGKTVQTLSLTLKKHGAQPRKPMRKPIEDPEDKAYLAGLIAGDLTARINHGSLIVQIGTTHYTPWHQLFQKFFAKYTSTIHETPRHRPDKKPKYEWNLYATLHPKDKWTLQTPKNKIPKWILENPKQQLPPYLAGLTDSEGGWHIASRYNRPPEKGGKEFYYIRYSIVNTQRQLLEEIRDLLQKHFKIKTFVTIAHKEGEKGRYSTKPAYKLVAVGNEAVELAILLLPHLKHPEKIERAKLTIKHGGKTLTQEDIEEWRKLRQKEKQQTLKDIELAKKLYQQKHNP